MKVCAGTLMIVAISTEDLEAIVARARTQAEATGQLRPVGPTHIELPPSMREAIGEALRSGVYEQAAREAIADDPEMTQL